MCVNISLEGGEFLWRFGDVVLDVVVGVLAVVVVLVPVARCVGEALGLFGLVIGCNVAL